ncbi:hypothetical protein D3Z37_00895 [Lachnospiraceae bacterium]|nr:hypothetical protein [Lachnospiraceae bacterium]NBI01577.1 hypothetical protein [Lachnospiraceae bacterium]
MMAGNDEKGVAKRSFSNYISMAAIIILLLAALLISSGKTRLVFTAVSIAAFLTLLLREQRRKQALSGFLLLFLMLSVFYNVQNLDRINPMTEVNTQTLYQEEDYVNQYYPDSFLRLLLKEHAVKIPYEIKHADEYLTDERREQGFYARYYKETNYGRFMRAYAKDCSISTDLPDMKETDQLVGQLSAFPCIGRANDMLRYTFLLNEDNVQESAYFWYSWYYYSYMVDERAEGKFFLYVRTEDIKEGDTLVALWDSAQNLYLMTEQYYENEVRGYE